MYRLIEHDSPKKIYSQGSCNIPPKVNLKRSIPQNIKGVNGSGSYWIRPICSKCGNKHNGKCLSDINDCYGWDRNEEK